MLREIKAEVISPSKIKRFLSIKPSKKEILNTACHLEALETTTTITLDINSELIRALKEMFKN